VTAGDRQPPRHRRGRPRPVHERTRDTDWWIDHELSLTVQCPPAPKGCGRPTNDACVNRWGEELVNQPAHTARTARARAAELTATEETHP